jgi:hypothetical protein
VAGFWWRLVEPDDAEALRALIDDAIRGLQRGFLTEAQIEAGRAGMGLDAGLIADGTFFVMGLGGTLAGCGGWSRRATLYGGDHSGERDAALDPGRGAGACLMGASTMAG